jgi:hypothetical protein
VLVAATVAPPAAVDSAAVAPPAAVDSAAVAAPAAVDAPVVDVSSNVNVWMDAALLSRQVLFSLFFLHYAMYVHTNIPFTLLYFTAVDASCHVNVWGDELLLLLLPVTLYEAFA